MTGTLFLVATPIGNLEDITLRALRVLREVSLIAAEDTRRTARLLTHFGIQTPTLSFHEHNTRERIPLLVDRLRRGQDVGLVTDAGTPGVSDPGVELAQACLDAEVPLEVIPGVSAPLAAAVASGFPLDPMTIYGFAPYRSKDRVAWLSEAASVKWTFTFFEAPHRIQGTLKAASDVLGNRPMVVAREITKIHQEFLRGSAASILPRLGTPRGEITVVVGPDPRTHVPEEPLSDADVVASFCEMTKIGGFRSRGAAIAAVARKLGRSRRDVFAVLERSKLLSNDQ